MLVGRDGELATLAESVGQGRSVVIVGEAGIGKSSLMSVALRQVGREAWSGVCLASLGWMSYMPLSRALGGSLPATADPGGVARLVSAGVGDGVLVLDDLHWADPETLATVPLLTAVTVVAAVRRGDPGAAAAIEAAESGGLLRIDLNPLEAGEAETVVRQSNPELSSSQVAKIVDTANGNPLLLEEFAVGGEASASLRLTMAARLQPHGAGAATVVARMALLGRPCSEDQLEADVADLADAGLVVGRPGEWTLRHALLGDAALELLSEDDVRRLHARLAELVESPGEAAAHHVAAGQPERARDAALVAAEQAVTPGERARHLGLAARHGPPSPALQARAAKELTEAGEFQAAIELAESIRTTSPDILALVELSLGTARSSLDGPGAGEPHFQRGLQVVPEQAHQLRIELLLERARILLYGEWGAPEALAAAAEARAYSEQHGLMRAETQHLLAMAEYVSGDERCVESARRAMSLAREEGKPLVELTAGGVLGSSLESLGDPAGAYAVNEELIALAGELALSGQEAELLAHQGHLELFHRSDYDAAIDKYERVLSRAGLLGPLGSATVALYSLALVDRGRGPEARELLRRHLETTTTPSDRLMLLYALAECAWLEGSPQRAIELAEAALEAHAHNPNRTLAVMTLNWARLDLDQRPVHVQVDDLLGALAGAQRELDGLVALVDGDAARAHSDFREAIRLWADRDSRSSLRSRLGAARAAIALGSQDDARERLLELERYCTDRRLPPWLGRVRRLLRSVGVSRGADAATGDGHALLSPREREVLELVGGGLTSNQISARLGTSVPTVNTQIRSAMRKLGARSRREAAALAARGTVAAREL